MYKNYFLTGIISSVVSIAISYGYCLFYQKLIVDFSEVASLTKIISGNLVFGMTSTFVLFGLHKLFRNKALGNALFAIFGNVLAMLFVLYLLKMDDPTFKSEDASLFSCYFKGFVIPLIFLPVLSWYVIFPFFSKEEK